MLWLLFHPTRPLLAVNTRHTHIVPLHLLCVQNEDGSVRQDTQRSNLASAEITDANNLVFAGALFNRGAFAEVGAELNPLLPGGDERLKDTEGLTLRVRAEGHTYACVLRTRELRLGNGAGSGRRHCPYCVGGLAHCSAEAATKPPKWHCSRMHVQPSAGSQSSPHCLC
jgi:hypothetical protein